MTGTMTLEESLWYKRYDNKNSILPIHVPQFMILPTCLMVLSLFSMIIMLDLGEDQFALPIVLKDISFLSIDHFKHQVIS